MTKQELEDKLLSLLKGKRKVLIITHENPDPDSIAAAFGLKYIFRRTMGVSSIIAYGGIIGRAENQSMVKLLDIDMVPLGGISTRNYSVIAVVDCQPHTGNLHLAKGVRPNIIIDHHPLRKSSENAEFIDVRRGIGSTSTIIAQYIRLLGIEMDKKVATALFYGIKSDTRDLGRQSTDADIRASVYLFPYTLQKKLARIEHPEMPKEYFIELCSVLNNAKIYGDVVVARVNMIGWPEMIGEFADELIQMEGMRWCICYGRHNGSLLFSIRTTRSSHMAGVLAHKICHGIGKGGGHETFAAGKIDLAQALKKVRDPEDILLKRFLKEVTPRGSEPSMLIPKTIEEKIVSEPPVNA
ncbi:MAG TPA: bifunctional oligoribonuclease/PAP phosphatase NrnA [Deltaproteobacteria bacterium]|nr:bifunctional oligoribonuclease/PAP phosphatase NrnA [Deltaproteobacteria bacterium]